MCIDITYIVNCKHVHGIIAHSNDAYLAGLTGKWKIHTIAVNKRESIFRP